MPDDRPLQMRGVPTDADRERYSALLLNALERGLLDDAQYMRRAQSIERAASVGELNDIVQSLPVLERAGQVPGMHRVVASKSGVRFAPPLTVAPATESTATAVAAPPRPSDDPEHPALDPVDLAIMSRAVTQRSVHARRAGQGRRSVAIAASAILFLVLIVLGVVLAVHTRPSGSSPPSVSHPASSFGPSSGGGASVLSLRSPRR